MQCENDIKAVIASNSNENCLRTVSALMLVKNHGEPNTAKAGVGNSLTHSYRTE
jgi:hypothetical protein